MSRRFLFSKLDFEGLEVELTVGHSFYLTSMKSLGRTCNRKEEGDVIREAPESKLGPAKVGYRGEQLDSTRGRYFWSLNCLKAGTLQRVQFFVTGRADKEASSLTADVGRGSPYIRQHIMLQRYLSRFQS